MYYALAHYASQGLKLSTPVAEMMCVEALSLYSTLTTCVY